MVAFFSAAFIGLVNLLYFIVVVKGHPLHPQAQDRVRVNGMKITSEKFAAGVLIYFLGAVSLVSWVYFMLIGFDSFRERPLSLLPHVGLQLGAALLMIISGHAVLHSWRRHTSLFFLSLLVVVGASLASIFFQGGQANSFEMHVFSTFVQLMGSVFSAAVFAAGMIFGEESNLNETDQSRNDGRRAS